MRHHARLARPHLVVLRGVLDEVARHRRAGELRVAHARQHAVQRVTELVVHRRDFIESEQRRLAGLGLGDVQVIGHHRLVMQQLRLRHVGGHPRPALLVVACEVVGQEQRERPAVGVEYLEHPHIRLVDGQVPVLLETEAIELVRGVEHTIQQHVIELEVRRDARLIEIVACLAHLLRIERPVPGLQGE